MEKTPFQEALAHMTKLLCVIQPQLKNLEKVEVQAVSDASNYLLEELKKMEGTQAK